MANFTLTVPDAQVPRITAAFADTGQTPKQFLMGQLVAWVRAFEEQKARDAAMSNIQPVNDLPVT